MASPVLCHGSFVSTKKYGTVQCGMACWGAMVSYQRIVLSILRPPCQGTTTMEWLTKRYSKATCSLVQNAHSGKKVNFLQQQTQQTNTTKYNKTTNNKPSHI